MTINHGRLWFADGVKVDQLSEFYSQIIKNISTKQRALETEQ